MELIKQIDQEVKFLDGSVVTFEVASITKDEKQMILKSAKHNVKNIEKTEDDFLNRIDFKKFNRMVILRAIRGWHGLKNKHLLIVYDTGDESPNWEFKGDKGRETEIPFTEDLKRELAEMYSVNFMTWLNGAMDEIDAANAKVKEAELKN
jgi:hypothetical protein